MLIKILKHVLMAVYLKLIIDFLTAQWNVISNAWSIFIITNILTSFFIWIVISWVQKEKFDSVRERKNNYKERVEELVEENENQKTEIENLKKEILGLRKDVFINKESEMKAQFDTLADIFLSTDIKRGKILLLEILNRTKSYILGDMEKLSKPKYGGQLDSSLNLIVELSSIEFDSQVYLLDSIINEILTRKIPGFTYTPLKFEGEKITDASQKIRIVNKMINKLSLIDLNTP